MRDAIRAVASAAALASALLLTGCSAPVAATFGSAQGVPSLQCVQLARGERALLGDVLVAKAAAVTVRAATLQDAVGVRVLRTYLVTNPRGGVTFGVTKDPPTGDTASQIGWASRAPLPGAAVPANAERNVVLEVQRTAAATGTASAIRVDVTAAGGDSSADSAIRYRFASRC